MRERDNADDDTMQMPPTLYIPLYILSLATAARKHSFARSDFVFSSLPQLQFENINFNIYSSFFYPLS